jgi:hypothetical protein
MHIQSMLSSHPAHAGALAESLELCIEACIDCAESCRICARRMSRRAHGRRCDITARVGGRRAGEGDDRVSGS